MFQHIEPPVHDSSGYDTDAMVCYDPPPDKVFVKPVMNDDVKPDKDSKENIV